MSRETFDGKCHRKSNRRHFARDAVRMKRCGKSAPREAQATRHGKPHRVQGQIGNPGAARSEFRESETGSGYRLLRQMILSARKSADRIRLTALPKPFLLLPGPLAGRFPLPIQTGKLVVRANRRSRAFLKYGRLTQVFRSIHCTNGNHIGLRIKKSAIRLICWQNFRRPDTVDSELQDP